MTNDDRQSEHFIREVDEELRRAQMKAIWDRFAGLIIGACVLVVLITAGYRGWVWWQERQAAEAGHRFMTAAAALDGDDRAAGERQLADIAKAGGDGYGALARLRLAGEKAAAGDKPAALAAYDAVASDGAVPASLADLARLRAALLALDTGNFAGAEARAAPLNQAGSAWRHSAREVLGIAAYQSQDLQKARDHFTEIQEDAETPPDLWARSGMMVSLIDGQLATPGTAPAEANAATPADGAEPSEATVPPGPAPAPAPPPVGEPAPATASPPPAGGAPGQTIIPPQ